jgi:replication initiation and membrane attachment protein DnaB
MCAIVILFRKRNAERKAKAKKEKEDKKKAKLQARSKLPKWEQSLAEQEVEQNGHADKSLILGH